MIVLLLKITLLYAIALAVLPLMKRSSAALRHLLCAALLEGSLVLPLSLLMRQSAGSFRISVSASAARAMGVFPAGAVPVTRVAFGIWITVSALLLMRIAFGFWQVRRCTGTAVEVSPNVFEADVSVPLACGLLRPIILLPRGAGAWPASQRDAAIRHELAHLQRKDLWTNLAAHLACAVYWLHPLVWLVARNLRREQELACDDAVIHSGFAPDFYAEALVAAARNFTSTNLIAGCPMFTPATLKVRISRLLDSRVSRASSPAALLRVGVLLTTVLIAIGTMRPVLAQDEPHKVGGGVSAPHVIMKLDPEYTDTARKAKISGTVLLKVVIGPEGLAHDIRVMKSLGPDLDANAVKAVQAWRFEPGKLNGAPVSVIAQIEVNFRLLDDPPAPNN